MTEDRRDPSIEVLKGKVQYIEENMSWKCTQELVNHRLNSLDSKVESVVEGFAKIDKLVDSVNTLTTQIARKEESDKYLQKAIERHDAKIQLLEIDSQEIKQERAASSPLKKIGFSLLNFVITFVTAAALGTLFVTKK